MTTSNDNSTDFVSATTLIILGRSASPEALMAIEGIVAAVWLVTMGIDAASCVLRM